MPFFSQTVQHIRSSEIRDLMKLASRPDIISFAGGMPNNDLFPVAEVDEIMKQMNPEVKKLAFQYGPTPGYPPLLETLKIYLKSKGLPVDENRLMITTGSMQAINIMGMEFIDPGDLVLTETPSFIGGIAVFKSFQARIQGIPLQNDGIDLEKLAQILEKEHPKMLYVIPNFHNPAGIIYSKEKRLKLLEMLDGKNIILLEDDAYNELYFNEVSKSLTQPIMAMNNKDVPIVYTGSFSKILGPGFRLGWMLAPPEIYEKAQIIKQSIDACSPTFTQVIANEFLQKGYLVSYLEKIRKEYAERKKIMQQALLKYMPAEVTWHEPQGGFYYWLKLPLGVDAADIVRDSIKNGAVFVTGRTFDPAAQNKNHMRLAYSNMAKNQIDEGVKIIAQAVKQQIKVRAI